MTKPFKMAEELTRQLQSLGQIKHAWFTTFNLNMDFFELHVLSTLLQMDKPRSRIDFELMQQKLNGRVKDTRKGAVTASIDVKVFADQRMYDASDLKRTAIEVYGVNPALLDGGRKRVLNNSTLFHPKVIYLQDEEGRVILGAGSANLTLSGWSTNQEVFTFQRVECKHQVEAIRAFFRPLFEANRVETKVLPQTKMRSDIQPSDWHFVHTFIKNSSDGRHKTLLNHLLNHSVDESRDLVVWSPYFPSDLTGFIQRLKAVASPSLLKLHIVPDLVENQRMRTQWSEDLFPLLDESVCFYRSPVGKDDRSELCHAKVWMTEEKLAIGSWNFTSPGSNIDLDRKDTGQVNIEAGIIVVNQQQLAPVLTKPLSINKDHFMQDTELSQHSLEVTDLMPIEIRVVFDWKILAYEVELNKINNALEWKSVELRLPDVETPLKFEIQENEAIYTTKITLVQEPQALLVNHAYELILAGGTRYRGFIVECNSLMRRVEEFESLDDIFNSLIDGRSLQSNPSASLRSVLLGNDQDWLEEQGAGSSTEPQLSSAVSYFRMFQAMDSFEQRISSLKTDSMREQYAFVIPGCLVEMRSKIGDEMAKSANVFNWYMKQEFNLLVDLVKNEAEGDALKLRLKELRIESNDSEARSTGLQQCIGSREYRKLIKGKCGYVSV
ncbi:phospholipase D-like domain-containing protein [Photobacterium sanguinicancri]|uniref:hypothetical protein n=1 Tax=Photobacterium sanguinicancri TaxID=875932 RepID=UPI0021C44336|nr:hypothetical protein [Photobacterium sanguinicancri]